MCAIKVTIIKWWTKGAEVAQYEQLMVLVQRCQFADLSSVCWTSLLTNFICKILFSQTLIYWSSVSRELHVLRVFCIKPQTLNLVWSLNWSVLSFTQLCNPLRDSALAFPPLICCPTWASLPTTLTPEWRNFHVSHTGRVIKLTPNWRSRFMVIQALARPPWNVCKSI